MITIKARLKPFSHLPGTPCMVPGTATCIRAFPTRLLFTDLITGKTWEEPLPWKGPVEEFTVEMDLDRGGAAIFGKTRGGFRRHWIAGEKKRFEKLSLGKHTLLDWELVRRKMSIEELAPILFALGQGVPLAECTSPALALLHFTDKREIVPNLKNFFRVAFSGMLVPRLTDEEFQGIIAEGKTSGSPLALLRQGYGVLRSLFFEEANREIALLPLLPPEFHAGRLTHLLTTQGDTFALEWSKKILKRVVIEPKVTRPVTLILQKSLSSFRVNRKERHAVKEPLQLTAGKKIALDRFEK